MEMKRNPHQEQFCRVYLQTMDPDRAAAAAGYRDGYARLGTEEIQSRLETMRTAVGGQLRREDAVRRLAQLAFGQANDAVGLALGRGGGDPAELDLTAVSEIKVTDKGVEIKFLDRVRALETLCQLLESGTEAGGELYRVLLEAAGDGALPGSGDEESGWDHG
jgi:hypothetical protein